MHTLAFALMHQPLVHQLTAGRCIQRPHRATMQSNVCPLANFNFHSRKRQFLVSMSVSNRGARNTFKWYYGLEFGGYVVSVGSPHLHFQPLGICTQYVVSFDRRVFFSFLLFFFFCKLNSFHSAHFSNKFSEFFEWQFRAPRNI